MELEQARELLGVNADTDRKSVRRAYLRLLKKHKPEQDPEGFQRLRRAYELCSQRAASTELEPELDSGPPPVLRSEPQTPTDVVDAMAPSEVPAAPAADQESEAIWKLEEEIYAEDDPRRRLERIEKAREQFPRSSAFIWAHFDVLVELDETLDAVELARSEASQEEMSLLREAAAAMPQQLEESDWDLLAGEGAEQGLAAAELLVGHRPDEAFGIARVAIENLDRPAFEGYNAIAVVCALEAQGRFAESAELSTKLHGRIRDLGAGKAMPPVLALQVHWLSQLAQLPEDFDKDVRQALAACIEFPDDEERSRAVARLVRSEKAKARAARALLKKHAPDVARDFGDLLVGNMDNIRSEAESTGDPPRDKSAFSPGCLTTYFVLAFISFGAKHCMRSHEAPDVHALAELQLAEQRASPRPNLVSHDEMIRSRLGRLCRGPDDCPLEPLMDELAQGNCEAVWDHYTDLESVVAEAGEASSLDSTLLVQLRLQIEGRCSAAGEPP